MKKNEDTKDTHEAYVTMRDFLDQEAVTASATRTPSCWSWFSVVTAGSIGSSLTPIEGESLWVVIWIEAIKDTHTNYKYHDRSRG